MKYQFKSKKEMFHYLWDYYHVHIFIGLFVLAFAGILVKDLLVRDNYGSQIVMVSSIYYSESVYTDAVSRLVDDTKENEDLKNKSILFIYLPDVENRKESYADVECKTKLMVTISKNKNEIYLVDQNALNTISNYDSSFFHSIKSVELHDTNNEIKQEFFLARHNSK